MQHRDVEEKGYRQECDTAIIVWLSQNVKSQLWCWSHHFHLYCWALQIYSLNYKQLIFMIAALLAYWLAAILSFLLSCFVVFYLSGFSWLISAEAGKILSLFSGTLESSLKLDAQRCTFVSWHQLSQLLPPLSLEFRRALVLSNLSSKCGNKKWEINLQFRLHCIWDLG